MNKIELDFEKGNGLVLAVIQDYQTKEVLMHASIDEEAWQNILESMEVWLWSRSKKKLWHKGETSGNIMQVKEIRFDCDCDCVLILVKVSGDGFACHFNKPSCFFRRIELEKGER